MAYETRLVVSKKVNSDHDEDKKYICPAPLIQRLGMGRGLLRKASSSSTTQLSVVRGSAAIVNKKSTGNSTCQPGGDQQEQARSTRKTCSRTMRPSLMANTCAIQSLQLIDDNYEESSLSECDLEDDFSDDQSNGVPSDANSTESDGCSDGELNI
jgi:hypothetical protein